MKIKLALRGICISRGDLFAYRMRDSQCRVKEFLALAEIFHVDAGHTG